jgi:probable HAF family extracellular repeat protein
MQGIIIIISFIIRIFSSLNENGRNKMNKNQILTIFFMMIFSTVVIDTDIAYSYEENRASVVVKKISYVDLGTLGNQVTTIAFSINNNSQIAGMTHKAPYNHPAFLWEYNMMTNLGYLSYISSAQGYDINIHKKIVGRSAVKATSNWRGIQHAFLWENGVMTDLGTLSGNSSLALNINDSDQIVGWSEIATGFRHAFLWENGVMTDLGTLEGGEVSTASSINNSGQIIGWSELTEDNITHAILWENGVMTDLGTFGGESSAASSINNAGQIVGWYEVSGLKRIFSWESGVMTDLGTLNGYSTSPSSNNNLGQIVGSAIVDTKYHPFIYENGEITDLYEAIANASMLNVQDICLTDINDKGEMVGYINTADNKQHAFLLTINTSSPPLSIAVIENLTTNEDIPISLTFYTHNVESESENITITVTQTQQELIQNISINSVSKYTHTMLIIPAEDAFGSTELFITVSDSVSTASRSLTVNVLPVNDPPMFSSTTVPVIFEDYGEKYISWADYVSPGPANESDQTCTFIVHPTLNSLLTSLPTISQNGILNFTTAPNAYGSVVFDVTLKDDGGTENNGIDTSSIQKFTIVVKPVNDCPIFMKGEDQIVHNRDGIQSIPAWALGINQGKNESNQTLQFIVETDNHSIFETIPEISTDGTLTYAPATDQTGSSLVTVYLKDSGGTDFSGCDTSMAQFFTITVLQTFYELTIFKEGQGKIKLNDREVLPNFIKSYQADTTLTLKAIPFENWKFAYWSGDIEDSSEDIQIILNRPITIVAHFYEPPVTLNLIGKKQIKINGIIHDLPCSKQINKHTTVYLEPVPVSDFLKWSGDINSTETNVTVLMENDTYIAVHYKDPFEWEAVIHAESQDLGGTFQDNITVGVSITPYTELYLSSNDFSCAMSIYSHEMDILSKDIRQDNDLITYQWLIAINPHGNLPPFDARITEITWDPQTFSPNGIYRLEKGYGPESEIVISDMRYTTAFTVEGINADQYFTLKWTTAEQNVFDYSLTSGWNLISLPVIPKNLHFQSIFHDATTAYEFKNGAYIFSSELTCGKGYWVKIPSDKTYTITGEPFRQNTINLSSGWHLIGTTNQEAIPSTIPESLIEAIYKYENNGYQLVESFEPGIGYWIKLSEDGEFSIGRK